MAAANGRPVTGVDSSSTAIRIAEEKARARGSDAHFLVWDALCSTSSATRSGRADVESLARVVTSGGHFYMLCFSDHVPGTMGPRRVTQDEIRAGFAAGWTVESIKESRLDDTWAPPGVEAWLATVRRS